MHFQYCVDEYISKPSRFNGFNIDLCTGNQSVSV